MPPLFNRFGFRNTSSSVNRWVERSRKSSEHAGRQALRASSSLRPLLRLEVSQEQKDAYLKSYLSAEGLETALTVLTHRQLSPELRQQVVDDTLGGAVAAKRAWFDQGMSLDIRDLVANINVPTTVIVGDADKVENERGLRRELGSRIKGTEFIVLPRVGHLSPLEAPDELTAAITTAIAKTR
jgi:pimeloyl-ACP methyl ester carboxylesterase